MRKLLAAIAVVFVATSVFAQGAAITGAVADESGGTLPGATVVVSGPGGSKTGYTDSAGKFSVCATWALSMVKSLWGKAKRNSWDKSAYRCTFS